MLGLTLLEQEDHAGGIKELEKVRNYVITTRDIYCLFCFSFHLIILFAIIIIKAVSIKMGSVT